MRQNRFLALRCWVWEEQVLIFLVSCYFDLRHLCRGWLCLTGRGFTETHLRVVISTVPQSAHSLQSVVYFLLFILLFFIQSFFIFIVFLPAFVLLFGIWLFVLVFLLLLGSVLLAFLLPPVRF